MSTWIIFAVIAQFLFSIVALLDKYIVTSKKVPRPIVYAFYVSLFSTSGILFFLIGFIPLPFESLQLPVFSNVSLPSFSFILLSILFAYSMVFGFASLFKAFEKADASDVVPIFQSMIAVGSFILPLLIFGKTLGDNFILGFIFLVVGTLLVSRFRVGLKTVFFAVIAGLLFAVQSFAFDILSDPFFYEFTNRDNALFWTRITLGLAALSLTLLPNCCGNTVKSDASHTKKKKGFSIIVGTRLLNGIAGFLIVTAIALVSVTDLPLLNAFGGLQFLFLLSFSLLFGHKTPYSCGEDCTKREKIQKVTSVFVILVGFILLFI